MVGRIRRRFPQLNYGHSRWGYGGGAGIGLGTILLILLIAYFLGMFR
jgi:hypothetical protein